MIPFSIWVMGRENRPWTRGLPIDILETRSSPHKGTAIADITSKMITEMAYRW